MIPKLHADLVGVNENESNLPSILWETAGRKHKQLILRDWVASDSLQSKQKYLWLRHAKILADFVEIFGGKGM